MIDIAPSTATGATSHSKRAAIPLAIKSAWRRIFRPHTQLGPSLDWSDERLLKDIGVDPPPRRLYQLMTHLVPPMIER